MRVNIEDRVWTDDRIIRLAIQMKLKTWAVVGAMAAIWRHCQENQTATISGDVLHHLIGFKNFSKLGEGVGLLKRAENNSEIFEVVGMGDRLNQIQEYKKTKSESGRLGGLKSGESRSKSEAKAKHMLQAEGKQNEPSPSMSLSKEENTNTEESLRDTVPPPAATVDGFIQVGKIEWGVASKSSNEPVVKKPKNQKSKQALESMFPEPTLSTSTSVVQTSKFGISKSKARVVLEGEVLDRIDPNKPPPPPHAQLVAHWKEQYFLTYGTNPPKPSGAEYSVAAKIYAKCETLEDAKALVEHYFDRKEQWYLNKGHNLTTLLGDINKLWAEMKTGNIMTKGTAKNLSLHEHIDVVADRAGQSIARGDKGFVEQFMEEARAEIKLVNEKRERDAKQLKPGNALQ